MGTSEGGSENIFQALQQFSQTPQAIRQLSQPIEDALEEIAKTGEVCYPWKLVHSVVEFKLQQVFQEFFESTSFPDQAEAEREHSELKEAIFSRLSWFDRPPFTVQRLCELVVWPKKHYTRCDKYMRGLTKVVKVVTTVGPPICNGTSHFLEPCNGNSLIARHDALSVSGLDMSRHASSASLSATGEDDTFSSFNLSPRQMPSPYSPPLSPTTGESRSLDDRPLWRSPSADTSAATAAEATNGAESDSDGSIDNTQSTVDLSEGGRSPSPGHANGSEAMSASCEAPSVSTAEDATPESAPDQEVAEELDEKPEDQEEPE